MLRMLSEGKVPEKEDLGLGKEEFVLLVSKALAEDLISGVYVSFCDNESTASLLSQAVLTDKGKERIRRRVPFFRFRR